MALPKAGVFAHAEGEVVAARIADTLAGRAPTATFTGQGHVLPRDRGRQRDHGRRRLLRGSAGGALDADSAENLAAKHAFETDRLTAWFGG